MCTSFIFRGRDTLIAMNYDNYGNNLEVAPFNKNLFLLTANLGGRRRPLFGVRCDGVFANQQFVPECAGGRFRKGEGVISTIRFIEKVLLGELPMEEMEEFLRSHEIVSPPESMISGTTEIENLPHFNIHTMVAKVGGDGYIVEPGRGIIKFDQAKKYIVMSNCSLCEACENGQYDGFGADRQIKAEQLLESAGDSFGVEEAFGVLKSVQLYQYAGFCSTEFSFVYSANENAAYYCYNRDFGHVCKYQMEKPPAACEKNRMTS